MGSLYGPGYPIPRCTSETSRGDLNEIINALTDKIVMLEQRQQTHARQLADFAKIVRDIIDGRIELHCERRRREGSQPIGSGNDISGTLTSISDRGTTSEEVTGDSSGAQGDIAPIQPSTGGTSEIPANGDRSEHAQKEGEALNQNSARVGDSARSESVPENSGRESEANLGSGEQFDITRTRLELGREFAREILRLSEGSYLTDTGLENIAKDAARLAYLVIEETFAADSLYGEEEGEV